MLQVLFIRLPGDRDNDKMFMDLRKSVSEACCAEVQGYRNKETGLRRLLGEALVIFALRTYWGLSPDSYRIARGDKGKPFLVGRENIHFNISHSGEYVVCAVSDREVGIDIEKRAKARMEVARRFFHEQEIEELMALSGDKQDELFFNYWSAKESFLKYVGTGLSRSLNSFVVKFLSGKVILCEDENELDLHVLPCSVDVAYACSVCGEYCVVSEIREVHFHDLILGCF